jgi:hypothetical protein
MREFSEIGSFDKVRVGLEGRGSSPLPMIGAHCALLVPVI